MNFFWRAGTFRCAQGGNEMRLTQWTDYTLRVLMYCAASDGRAQPVTVTEITAAHGISRSHLTKIVMALAAQGWLEWRPVLHQALEAYFRVLDGVTLADLVAQQQATEGVPLRWSPLPGIPRGRVG